MFRGRELPSPLPLRFKLECGPLHWRLRGLLVAMVATAAAAAPYFYSNPLNLPVNPAAVAAAAAVSILSGTLAGASYALAHAASLSYGWETAAVALAAAVLLGGRRDPVASRFAETLRSEALPRPTGFAAAALGAALSGAPGLPGAAPAIYAGVAAALAPSTIEAVALGLLGGLHPALAAALGAYLSSAPVCYRCVEGLRLPGVKLVGVYTRRFSCASGEASVAAVYNPMVIVIGSYSVELARRLAQSMKAEMVIAVSREEYEDAVRRAGESRAPLVVASTHLPETLLPPAPGRDTAVVATGIRDPIYLDRLAKSLRLDKRILGIFTSRPGLALAYPGCHGEVLLLEWR